MLTGSVLGTRIHGTIQFIITVQRGSDAHITHAHVFQGARIPIIARLTLYAGGYDLYDRSIFLFYQHINAAPAIFPDSLLADILRFFQGGDIEPVYTRINALFSRSRARDRRLVPATQSQKAKAKNPER
jgi:hypothetical protein